MLSSNSSSCNQNPNYMPFFENEITSFTSNLVEDPNFFSGFPNSPHLHFEYDDVYHHLQSLFDQQSAAVHAGLVSNTTPAAAAGQLTAAVSSKKDRHSKIHTARGPRDRRMRLSLDIARRFFDLQDMLGFDKASRTVDWLLRNASSAIGELERRSRGVCNNSESCTSKMSTTTTTTTTTRTSTKKVKKRGVKQKRATVARESRRKARERARERTSQKRRLMRENTTAAAADVNHLSSDFSQSTTNELVFPWNNAAFLEDEQNIAEFHCNGNPWQAYNKL